MEAAAGGGRGLSKGSRRGQMSALRDQSGAGQSGIDVLALAVNSGIDLVSDAVVALVALKTNVVGSGDAPQRPPVHRVSKAIILGTAEKVEQAHGHGQVVLFRERSQDPGDHRALNRLVHLNP